MPLVSSRIYKDVLQYSITALPGLSAKRKQIYSREKRETNGIVLAERSVNDTRREGNRKLLGTRFIYTVTGYIQGHRVHTPCVHNGERVSGNPIVLRGENVACRYFDSRNVPSRTNGKKAR